MVVDNKPSDLHASVYNALSSHSSVGSAYQLPVPRTGEDAAEQGASAGCVPSRLQARVSCRNWDSRARSEHVDLRVRYDCGFAD